MPASSRARSSSCPAGPTKGRPRTSSLSPGCSPTNTTRPAWGPPPNTAWTPSRRRGHAGLPEPEPAAPDWVPDDLVAAYGSDAKRRARRRRSRRTKVKKQARQLVRTTDADIMQTTVLVFLFGVIAVCGLGGVVYLV